MKGIRFYLEYDTPARKRKGLDMGNVVAVDRENYVIRNDDAYSDCIAAVFDYPNSPVAGSSCGDDWLRTCCKRISEARARKIHPALFAFLDYTSEE